MRIALLPVGAPTGTGDVAANEPSKPASATDFRDTMATLSHGGEARGAAAGQGPAPARDKPQEHQGEVEQTGQDHSADPVEAENIEAENLEAGAEENTGAFAGDDPATDTDVEWDEGDAAPSPALPVFPETAGLLERLFMIGAMPDADRVAAANNAAGLWTLPANARAIAAEAPATPAKAVPSGAGLSGSGAALPAGDALAADVTAQVNLVPALSDTEALALPTTQAEAEASPRTSPPQPLLEPDGGDNALNKAATGTGTNRPGADAATDPAESVTALSLARSADAAAAAAGKTDAQALQATTPMSILLHPPATPANGTNLGTSALAAMATGTDEAPEGEETRSAKNSADGPKPVAAPPVKPAVAAANPFTGPANGPAPPVGAANLAGDPGAQVIAASDLPPTTVGQAEAGSGAANSLGGGLSQTGAPVATGTGLTAQAQSVARQMAEAAQQKPDRPVELRLSPDELGPLRMTIVTSGDGISVLVRAERSETTDLLRRNIDILAQEFRDIGYADVSFSFAERQTPDAMPQQAAQEPVDTATPHPLAQLAALVPLRPTATTGLDLRL